MQQGVRGKNPPLPLRIGEGDCAAHEIRVDYQSQQRVQPSENGHRFVSGDEEGRELLHPLAEFAGENQILQRSRFRPARVGGGELPVL